MLQHQTRFSLVAIVLLFAAATARADESPATITATGNASINFRSVETLRVTLTIFGKADSPDAAIANLKKQRDALNDLLRSIGPCSTKFSDPTEAPSESQGSSGSLFSSAPSQDFSHAIVKSTLTAEFTLPTDPADTDKLAASNLTSDIEQHTKLADQAVADAITLQRKIHAAVVEARKKAGDGSGSDDPQFLFVHTLTADEQAKVLADAFADAQKLAGQLAAAAGKTAGKPLHISLPETEMRLPSIDPFDAERSEDWGVKWTASSSDRNAVQFSQALIVTFEMN